MNGREEREKKLCAGKFIVFLLCSRKLAFELSTLSYIVEKSKHNLACFNSFLDGIHTSQGSGAKNPNESICNHPLRTQILKSTENKCTISNSRGIQLF